MKLSFHSKLTKIAKNGCISPRVAYFNVFLHYTTFTAHLFFFLTATGTNSLEVLQNILFAGEFSSFFPTDTAFDHKAPGSTIILSNFLPQCQIQQIRKEHNVQTPEESYI